MRGELWAPNNGAVVVVLNPKDTNQYFLATITMKPGERSFTLPELESYFRTNGFQKIGRMEYDKAQES